MRATALITTLIVCIVTLVAFYSLAGAQEIATPTPTSQPAMMATVDRLAAPPTVENPTQADEGAQVYWLNCQPCHGDRGQGLTDEWRAQYPPEDRNCWARGCHGNVPYENGFKLPETVPALIGEGSLERFQSLGQLYTFIRAAMPFEAPGNLSDEEYLAITAYLARAHGIWDGSPLNVENVHETQFNNSAGVTDDRTNDRTDNPGTIPESQSGQTAEDQSGGNLSGLPVIVVGLAIILLFIGGAWLWRRSAH